MKIKFLIILLFISISSHANEIKLNKDVFNTLNLEQESLSEVKNLHLSGDDYGAAKALLNYYRERFKKNGNTNIKITPLDSLMATEALEHKLYVHEGFQPSFFYGDDINWDYWPVKDNELRLQLHRHKWFSAMGKMYKATGDEKFVIEWINQYIDWIRKNPFDTPTNKNAYIPAPDNKEYSWRGLEVSHRLRDQCYQFEYFVNSENFTPEFLTQFLANYYKHATNLMGRFESGGNHLVLQSERLFFGGTFFTEFKDANKWRKKTIANLNNEITKQVYDDGFQYEQCPHYHRLCASVFTNVLINARKRGYADEFPESFSETISKMYEAYYNIMFPDYSMPLFSDHRKTSKETELAYFNTWSNTFPENEQLEFFKSDGRSGEKPNYNSKGFLKTGFFTFRTGWDYKDTVMIVKTGFRPQWHGQPDNGTFDLYINGRNFMPDGGCYVYAGDDEIMAWRNWFKQTSTHKTLTLNNQNFIPADSKTLLWDTNNNTETLVTEIQGYENLKHRRSIFFVEKKFFVIVDQAMGTATGNVGIHYQFEPVDIMTNKNQIYTTYNDNNNILIQTTGNITPTLSPEEGWISYTYQKKETRPAYCFNIEKQDINPVYFVSVLLPIRDFKHAPKIKTKINKIDNNKIDLTVKIGTENYNCNINHL